MMIAIFVLLILGPTKLGITTLAPSLIAQHFGRTTFKAPSKQLRQSNSSRSGVHCMSAYIV
ncbi:hypothetical protein AKJ16_DCAP00396 [Drosera capensis]